jgi:hypothetical protein
MWFRFFDRRLFSIRRFLLKLSDSRVSRNEVLFHEVGFVHYPSEW